MSGDGPSGPLADLARGATAPVTLVFGTFDYRKLVARWSRHALDAGCRDYRIVCMDDRLLEYLREECAETRAVAYRALLPDTQRVDVDSMRHHRERLEALTPMRVTLFRALAEHGIDFIHSDADAYWLRDPRPWLGERGDYDLLASQGTVLPTEQCDRHGFVLCAGFFLCRANARTVRLWSTVEAALADCPDDQVCLNMALLNDPAGRWQVRDPRPIFAVLSPVHGVLRRLGFAAPAAGWFRLPIRPRTGERIWRGLSHTPWRRGVRRFLRRWAVRCIVTSESVIDGHFSGGLRVGIVPMPVVMRVPVAGADPQERERLLVLHVWGNKAVMDSRWEQSYSIPAAVRWWHAAARRRQDVS